MRAFIRWLCVALIALAGWAAPAPLAQAANLDTIAARVFGQPDFSHNTPNNGGLSPSSLQRPYSVALDAHGDLFAADYLNSRVLEYDRPLPLLGLFLPLIIR